MGGKPRKKGGRVTPKGSLVGRLTAAERGSLAGIFDRILSAAPEDLRDDTPPLAVELWASEMWSIWAKQELIGMDAVAVFAGGLISHSGKKATPAALAVLRALGAVAPSPYRDRARREADRLAAAGVGDQPWAVVIGSGAPTAASLSFDPIDDDGVSVMVGFDGPGQPCTVGLYVDHNLGGIAKDAFAVPAGIDEVLERMADQSEADRPEVRPISLKEAAARWRDALAMLDTTVDPLASDDLVALKALVASRLAALPSGGRQPGPTTLSDDERDRLLAEFMASDEAVGLLGLGGDDDEDATVEQLAVQIMSYVLDYTFGTPLRFSPVMVEIFCLDWAPRKIAAGGDGFTLLPDVLAAWICFAGRRRGIPEKAIREAIAAAYEHSAEMIDLAQEPERWGPAKTMALAIQERGIDITDQRALDGFVAEINRNGGIDVLADSLAPALAPRR